MAQQQGDPNYDYQREAAEAQTRQQREPQTGAQGVGRPNDMPGQSVKLSGRQEGLDERATQKPGSLGASRVRESFNPSGHALVDKLKRYTADLIDLCNDGMNKAEHPEESRLWSLAMTSYEDAAMWAVKAATTNK